MMLNNSRVGDILTIPVAVLNDFKYEIIKILDTINSGRSKIMIVKLKTSKDAFGIIYGVMTDNFEDSLVGLQVMRKHNDKNSVSIEDIELNYYKWKQSKKFIR